MKSLRAAVCGCTGEQGATEPISVSTAQRAQRIREVLNCLHSSGLPTLGESAAEMESCFKGAVKHLQTFYPSQLHHCSRVTMFRCEVKVEHIVTV